jgi:hypothetical protein
MEQVEMKDGEPPIDSSRAGGMPETRISRWAQPLVRFFHIESASGFLLLTTGHDDKRNPTVPQDIDDGIGVLPAEIQIKQHSIQSFMARELFRFVQARRSDNHATQVLEHIL